MTIAEGSALGSSASATSANEAIVQQSNTIAKKSFLIIAYNISLLLLRRWTKASGPSTAAPAIAEAETLSISLLFIRNNH
jgi:hypothetical protein